MNTATQQKPQHTPEPWFVRGKGPSLEIISSAELGVYIASFPEWGAAAATADQRAPNAARIVACVNACAGIASETLQSIPQGYVNYIVDKARQLQTELDGAKLDWENLNRLLEGTRQQRDELLEAAKGADEAMGCLHWGESEGAAQHYALRAAIAKAGG